MSLFKSSPATPLAPLEIWSRRRIARLVPLAIFHLLACAIAVWSEAGTGQIVMFLAAWGLMNFFWLLLLRRPGLSAALSLTMLVILIVISRFKFDVLWMTASFVDVMIIDADTIAFLWMMFPTVRVAAAIALVVAIP